MADHCCRRGRRLHHDSRTIMAALSLEDVTFCDTILKRGSCPSSHLCNVNIFDCNVCCFTQQIIIYRPPPSSLLQQTVNHTCHLSGCRRPAQAAAQAARQEFYKSTGWRLGVNTVVWRTTPGVSLVLAACIASHHALFPAPVAIFVILHCVHTVLCCVFVAPLTLCDPLLSSSSSQPPLLNRELFNPTQTPDSTTRTRACATAL